MSFLYHKGGVSSNVTRGRGFSQRGSFRGRGGTENGSNTYNSPTYTSASWSSTSRGRGSFTPTSSRGRGNWYNKDNSSNFDTRKYSSNSPLNQSGNDRYSSRGRGDDPSYRRYSRMDGPGYSSREHTHHRSPEGSRKRLHSERTFIQPSSSRRSHENTYSGSSEYGNRYSGFNEEKSGSGYGDDRGRVGSSVGSYRDDGRRSSGGFRSERSRGDDYHGHRKPDLDSSMPPPQSTGSRGGYRGRMMRGSGRGGISRILLKRQEILSRKRSDFLARRRLLGIPGRFHDETLRKLKIQKLRRIQRAKEAKEATSDNETSDNPKEENWDDDEKVEKEKKEKKSEDSEKKKSSKKDKEKEKDKDKEKEKDEDDGEEEVEEEEEGEPPKKKKKVPESESHVRHSSASRSVRHTRPYIKLACPQCYERCVTFKNYTLHLYSPKHAAMMRKQSLRHKQTLAKMRMAQRAKQRVLDVEEEDSGAIARTNFCHICKLNYRQLKSKHALSDSHRDMKKFLMPFCRICRISCKSPMAYENHICSLEHIRREARLKELGDKKRHSSEDKSQDEDDDKELNLDNFMTVDSVGVVDESGLNDDEKTENKNSEKQKEVPLGTEFVKNITAQYCELCSMYLSRGDKEKVLAQHCRTRTHLKRYVRNRQERSLDRDLEAKRAEKEIESKKKKSETVKRSEDEDVKEDISSPEKSSSPTTKRVIKSEPPNKENETTEQDETVQERPDNEESAIGNEAEADGEDPDTIDDILGELLREDAPGNKSSDEDEDSRAGGGRYDRFRLSEKERANTSAPSSEPDGIEKPSNATIENQPDEESGRTVKVEEETPKKSTSPNKEESSKNTE